MQSSLNNSVKKLSLTWRLVIGVCSIISLILIVISAIAIAIKQISADISRYQQISADISRYQQISADNIAKLNRVLPSQLKQKLEILRVYWLLVIKF